MKAHLALFIVNLIYAISYGFSKDVMEGYLPSFTFILIRVIGATALFWIFTINSKEKIKKSDLGLFAISGLFGVAANQLMFFEGLHHTSTINASILMVASPILVLVFARIILKEKLTLLKFIGILVGLSGALFLILQKDSSSKQVATFYGNLLVFLNASSYGLYLVIVKPLMQHYRPITVIKYVFTFGLIFTIPFGLSQTNEVVYPFPSDVWLKIGFIVFFTTFITYLFTVYALGKVSPTVVSSYIYLQPILTALIASIEGIEKLTFFKIICGLMIFLGVFLIGFKPAKRKETSNQA